MDTNKSRGLSSIALGAEGTTGDRKWSSQEIVAFTCNYMVGTGFLTLPHAMAGCGLWPGVLVLVSAGLLAVFSSNCVLEALARMAALSIRGPYSSRVMGYGALEEETDEDPVIRVPKTKVRNHPFPENLFEFYSELTVAKVENVATMSRLFQWSGVGVQGSLHISTGNRLRAGDG